MMSMLLASTVALSNVHAEENVKNVDIVYGAAKVENGKFYNPTTVQIEVGTTVSWMNIDKDPHTVTDGTPDSKWGQIFDSGIMRQGREYKYTFNEPGTYSYLCALHPWMYGKVIVENPVKNNDVTIVQKLNMFMKSDQQSYSEDQIVRFTIDVLGAGNSPTDPDTINAQFGTVNDDKPRLVNMTRLDVGKYVFSTGGLKPASYTLSVKASKDGFEHGSSMLTIHITKREVPKEQVHESLSTVSIAVDRLKYSGGDTVKVSGKVSTTTENKFVVFQVFDSENRLYTRGQTQLNANTFEWAFKVVDTISGMWTVKAKHDDDVGTAIFEIAKSKPVASTPEPAKTQPLPIADVPAMKFKDEKVTLARSMITDHTSAQLYEVRVGQSVAVQSVIRNNQETEQIFAYIVQIKDSGDAIVKLEAVEGILPAGKSFTVSISWMPEVTGAYSAEAFVWKSLKEPVPLSLNLPKTNFTVNN